MKIDIPRENLWTVRRTLSERIRQMEDHPNHSACGKTPEVCRNVVRKLDRAIKKAYGRDQEAEEPSLLPLPL